VEEYERDILSRPSVFDKKTPAAHMDMKGHTGGKDSPSTSKSKPAGHAHAEKRSISAHPHRTVKKGGVENYDKTKSSNEELDLPEDELIGAHSFRGTLKSPGAVLKARKMFEVKAQESAMDRASAGFHSNATHLVSKVTKKTAIFGEHDSDFCLFQFVCVFN